MVQMACDKNKGLSILSTSAPDESFCFCAWVGKIVDLILPAEIAWNWGSTSMSLGGVTDFDIIPFWTLDLNC